VFTEESSQRVAPLPEQPGDPLQPSLPPEIRRSANSEDLARLLPWVDVARAGGVWVSSVALLLTVPLMITLPYLVYRIILLGPPTAEAIATDKMLLFLSVAAIVPTHLLTVVVAWMVVTEGGRYPFWKTVGFEWPQRYGPLLTSLISLGLAISLLLVAWLITNFFGGGKTDLDALIESSMPARFATAFVALATAPLVEELIYRGVIYSALERAAGTSAAIIFVSLLFAGVHVLQYRNNISVILVITLLSFTLTITRAVTGKVLPCFIIHLVFNGVQSLILVLAPFWEQGTK
jgi:membrane protease YdiL (CAAX protease family)